MAALHRVAVLVDDDVSAFEFAIACEVFGLDRSDAGLAFDFRVCSVRPGPLRATGFTMQTEHGLADAARADLIIVPPLGLGYQPPPELVACLTGAVQRGARVMALCSGAFVLARTGLLAGRRATTHWRYTERFAAEFPDVDVVPDVLFVEDGPILTSAGTAAGIDLCLHLIREEFGARAANAVARRMVVPPQREGGQAQYVRHPVPEVAAESLAPVLDWAQEHLAEDLSVAVLAKRALMSPRTFARRFREETGTTPHHWVLTQRVALADRLLEEGDLPIEGVAERCGFGSATMLRHHFRRLRGTSPNSYRRTFGVRAAG
ncbi:MAG: helix-turn-helix domain-containing protein [Candidatus Nanopelagicales bacterium]|nr:helix-turn-helix domain-containing protein [Candidatus Nanopelagicales bacterium]